MDNNADNKVVSIEDHQKFLVTRRESIVQKLRMLAKHHSLVTAFYDNGKSTITAVIDIIKDMDLVALDYGSDEALNRDLLNAQRVQFKTQLEGVNAQFSANSVIKAKYQGEAVFAIPIPDEMLWMQRREFYRVRVPLGMPMYCKLVDSNGRQHTLAVFDISAGGLALLDEKGRLEVDTGERLDHCELQLPEHGSGKICLEVRNVLPHRSEHHPNAKRIGCLFCNVDMSFGATIQRYIHSIETFRKRIDE